MTSSACPTSMPSSTSRPGSPSMTAFWLVDAPSPAGRRAARQPRAASRRLCHRRRLRARCAAPCSSAPLNALLSRRACAGLLHGGRHRRRHRLDRSLQALHRHHAARPASSLPRPSAATVAVGRWGCFFSGLADFTYGTPTAPALGCRLRRRHRPPSGAALRSAGHGRDVRRADPALLERAIRFWLGNGFYLVVGWYGLQRFVWEFFKPYATVVGPFNLFHWSASAWSCTLPS